jgi:hypothetical protein
MREPAHLPLCDLTDDVTSDSQSRAGERVVTETVANGTKWVAP